MLRVTNVGQVQSRGFLCRPECQLQSVPVLLVPEPVMGGGKEQTELLHCSSWPEAPQAVVPPSPVQEVHSLPGLWEQCVCVSGPRSLTRQPCTVCLWVLEGNLSRGTHIISRHSWWGHWHLCCPLTMVVLAKELLCETLAALQRFAGLIPPGLSSLSLWFASERCQEKKKLPW